jgi:hypothetical protein
VRISRTTRSCIFHLKGYEAYHGEAVTENHLAACHGAPTSDEACLHLWFDPKITDALSVAKALVEMLPEGDQRCYGFKIHEIGEGILLW